MRAHRAIVRGRVQGVGYRYFAERAARELGVRGWVRNLPDGSVEAVVEGDDALVGQFLERLRQGPRGSGVESVVAEDQPVSGFSSFEITR